MDVYLSNYKETEPAPYNNSCTGFLLNEPDNVSPNYLEVYHENGFVSYSLSNCFGFVTDLASCLFLFDGLHPHSTVHLCQDQKCLPEEE